MGELQVYFVGICTHMQWQDDPGWADLPGFNHRVVLVNGTTPHVIAGKFVPKHTPSLRIAATDLLVAGVPAQTEGVPILEWLLDGVHLSIAEGVGELTYDKSYESCIPHLQVVAKGELPRPSADVVTAGDPTLASCYFEIEHGTIQGGLLGAGAASALLHARTKGDPVLRIRSFRTGVAYDLELRSGASIAVLNTGEAGIDDPNDFLLHYETAVSVPIDATYPQRAGMACRELPGNAVLPPLNVGPGCSNSIFP